MSRLAPFIALTGLGALAVGAYRLFSGSSSRSGETPKAKPSESNKASFESPSYPMPAADVAARHRGASEIMTQAFERVMGRKPEAFELEYALAVASLETSYGKGWSETRCPGSTSSNNWGAVQAQKGNAKSFPCKDTYPDGKEYSQAFVVYDTPVDGAADVVKHVFVSRASVADALDSNDATIWRASLAMRRTSYYGGWCKKTVAEYGSINYSAQKNPTEPKDIACEKEAATQHVEVVRQKISQIAPSLGLPAIPVGSYEDAIDWYTNRAKA